MNYRPQVFTTIASLDVGANHIELRRHNFHHNFHIAGAIIGDNGDMIAVKGIYASLEEAADNFDAKVKKAMTPLLSHQETAPQAA